MVTSKKGSWLTVIFTYVVLLYVTILLVACYKDMEVAFDDFIDAPYVTVITTCEECPNIKIKPGFTKTSSLWITFDVKINGNSVLISGKYTMKEQSAAYYFRLQNPESYLFYWVDKEGKHQLITQPDRLG